MGGLCARAKFAARVLNDYPPHVILIGNSNTN